jgi:hypothetical protein
MWIVYEYSIRPGALCAFSPDSAPGLSGHESFLREVQDANTYGREQRGSG